MPELLDIAPASEPVDVRGTVMQVGGVDAAGLVYLLRRYPELRKMLATRTPDIEALLNIGGDAPHAIIAAGLGHPSDEGTAKVKSWGLVAGEQLELLAPIVHLTAPKGFGPLTIAIERLTGVLDR